jgi:hypothetical protein
MKTEVVTGRAGRPLLHWGNGVVSLMLTTPTGKIPVVTRLKCERGVDLVIEGERNRGEDFGLCATAGLIAHRVSTGATDGRG